jgi:hypothetical protein
MQTSASEASRRGSTRRTAISNATTLDDATKTAHSEGLGEIIQIVTDSPTRSFLLEAGPVRHLTFGIAKPTPTERAGSGDPWPDSYHLFRLIPKYWLLAWVQSAKFTAAVLELIEGWGMGATRKIIEFCTGRKDTSKAPPSCPDKLIMSRTLGKAYGRMGARLSDEWFDSAISPTGEILWQSSGVYSLKAHEGKIHSIIKHVVGLSVIIHRKLYTNLLQSA